MKKKKLDAFVGSVERMIERRPDILAGVLAVLVVGIAVGWVMGLTHHHNKNEVEMERGRECVQLFSTAGEKARSLKGEVQ